MFFCWQLKIFIIVGCKQISTTSHLAPRSVISDHRCQKRTLLYVCVCLLSRRSQQGGNVCSLSSDPSTQCPNWFPFALGLVVFASKYSEVQAAMALINNTWWFCSSSGCHTKPWASHFVFRTLDTPTVLETEKRGRREMPLRICTIRPLCTGWPFSTHTKLDLPCRTSPHFTWSLNKRSWSSFLSCSHREKSEPWSSNKKDWCVFAFTHWNFHLKFDLLLDGMLPSRFGGQENRPSHPFINL